MTDTRTLALLATGDEIVNGDILNTNGQTIAQQCLDIGLPINMQLCVKDQQTDLVSAIDYLLTQHDLLITIGGLGPTSDDRTRFALAQYLDLPLEFDQDSWGKIIARLNQYGLSVPESNRQQAQFPQGAHIIANQNGTANACKIEHLGKTIYMLPGPPNECLPIFQQVVLPELAKRTQALHRKTWLLFGVSEGHTADKLDTLVLDQVEIGYRVNYPYLEVKLFSRDKEALEKTAEQFLPVFNQHLVGEGRETYSQRLSKALESIKQPLIINDQATHGLLEKTLITKANHDNIIFSEHDAQVTVTGLDSWWQDEATESVSLDIKTENDVKHFELPYRPKKTRHYAVELIARQLLSLF